MQKSKLIRLLACFRLSTGSPLLWEGNLCCQCDRERHVSIYPSCPSFLQPPHTPHPYSPGSTTFVYLPEVCDLSWAKIQPRLQPSKGLLPLKDHFKVAYTCGWRAELVVGGRTLFSHVGLSTISLSVLTTWWSASLSMSDPRNTMPGVSHPSRTKFRSHVASLPPCFLLDPSY